MGWDLEKMLEFCEQMDKWSSISAELFPAKEFTPNVINGLKSLGIDVDKMCAFLKKHNGYIVGRFITDAIAGKDSLDKYSKKEEEKAKLDGYTIDFTTLPYKEHLHIVVVDENKADIDADYLELIENITHPVHLIKTKESIKSFLSGAMYSFQTCYFDGVSVRGVHADLTSKKKGYELHKIAKRHKDDTLEQFYIDKGYTIIQ